MDQTICVAGEVGVRLQIAKEKRQHDMMRIASLSGVGLLIPKPKRNSLSVEREWIPRQGLETFVLEACSMGAHPRQLLRSPTRGERGRAHPRFDR